MSAVLDATGTKYLSASLTGSVPTPSNQVLQHIFVKGDSGATQTSNQYAFQLTAATEGSLLRMNSVSGPKFRAEGLWKSVSGSAGASLQSAVYVNDAWRSCATYLEQSGTGFSSLIGYDGTTKSAATAVTDDGSATESLTELKIGQGANTNSLTRFPGRVAEYSLWIVTSEAVADSVVTALQTTPADQVSVAGATLLYYYPLLDSRTATIGVVDLTDHGTVTFDGADHPSLSGGGGGGATVFDYSRGLGRGIARGIAMGLRRSIMEVRRPGLWLPPSLIGVR